MDDIGGLSQLIEFIFADKSIKMIIFIVAWDCRRQFKKMREEAKEMRLVMERLAINLGKIESEHNLRLERLEDRIIRFQSHQTHFDEEVFNHREDP